MGHNEYNSDNDDRSAANAHRICYADNKTGNKSVFYVTKFQINKQYYSTKFWQRVAIVVHAHSSKVVMVFWPMLKQS